MIIQKDSWHYRLVKSYSGQFFEFDRTCYDSCSYIRHVVWVITKVVFLTAATGVGLGVTVGDFMAWIVAMIMTGEVIGIGFGATAVVAIIIMILFFTAWSLLLSCYRHFFPFQVRKTPSFVRQAYDHVHDKYCSKLEVV
jgi:hypothetical protein